MALEGAAAHLISARVTAAAECRLRGARPGRALRPTV